MKIAVTGSTGQLGCELQEISKNFPGLSFFFHSRKELDVSSYHSIEKTLRTDLDYIINCAAYTHVDLAEDERDRAFAVNKTGPENLAKFCKTNATILVHISTDYVYAPAKLPIREDDTIDPLNIYGLSKWEGEERIRQILPEHFILRTAWLYSSFGHNFVKTMLRLSSEKDSLNVVNDQVGSPTYARSLARGILHVIQSPERKEPDIFGTYNYADHGAVSWYDFAREIIHSRHPGYPVNPVTSDQFVTKAKRSSFSVLDCSKFENTFLYRIPDWKSALQECLTELLL